MMMNQSNAQPSPEPTKKIGISMKPQQMLYMLTLATMGRQLIDGFASPGGIESVLPRLADNMKGALIIQLKMTDSDMEEFIRLMMELAKNDLMFESLNG